MAWPKARNTGLAAVGVAVALLLTLCAYYGVWSLREYRMYRDVVDDSKIGSDLWWGHIGPGDDVEELIANSEPNSVVRFGRWVRVQHGPGRGATKWLTSFVSITVLAKDGRLVYAKCRTSTDLKWFFNTMSDSEEVEHNRDFGDYWWSFLEEKRNAQPADGE